MRLQYRLAPDFDARLERESFPAQHIVWVGSIVVTLDVFGLIAEKCRRVCVSVSDKARGGHPLLGSEQSLLELTVCAAAYNLCLRVKVDMQTPDRVIG